MKAQEWLLPETIASFNELPLQYNGFCGHALVRRDGLLLPGIVLFIHNVTRCLLLRARYISTGGIRFPHQIVYMEYWTRTGFLVMSEIVLVGPSS